MSNSVNINSVSERMEAFSDWETFLRPSDEVSRDVIDCLRGLYQVVTGTVAGHSAHPVSQQDQLYVSGFTDDQLWQQIDASVNRPVTAALKRSVAGLTSGSVQRCLQSRLTTSEPVSGDSDVEISDEVDSTSDVLEDGEEGEEETTEVSQPSVVDDPFFSLSEMEKFLEREDAREMAGVDGRTAAADDEDAEMIDMFADLPSDEEDDEMKASELCGKDFLKMPKSSLKPVASHRQSDGIPSSREESSADKSVRFDIPADPDASSGDDDDAAVSKSEREKSSWEKRQEKMSHEIARLEESLVSDKPWQMTGEVSGVRRPENSLLEEHVEFERATRLAPVITEQTTRTLEDVIRQRVMDSCWDDVEAKTRPDTLSGGNPGEYKRRLVLEQDKSKKSLHEIYEDEYIKQNQGSKGVGGGERVEEEDPAHTEIRHMMESLFYKLNALSNYHYTPKLPRTDVKIINNLPSISMEEVAPTHVSDADRLAPEEIMEKPRGEVKADLERSKTDKLSSRRHKKRVQKLKRVHRERKEAAAGAVAAGPGNKFSSKRKLAADAGKQVKRGKNVTVLEDDKQSARGNKALKSSKAFFDQLQTEVATQMKMKKDGGKKKKKKTSSGSVEKYKL